MKQESVKHLADGATISAVSTGASSYFGWFTFINENAPGIGVLLSFFFGVIGLIFYYLTWKKSTLAETNKKELDSNKKELANHGDKLDAHIKESTEQFKFLGDGIKTLLDRKP